MGSSTAGYIIVKNGDKSRRSTYREFYGSLDKGAAKPAFCYPKRIETLKEDIAKTERALEFGQIPKDREMETKVELRKKQERLDKIGEEGSAARKLFEENKDNWMKRRESLKEEISESIPSREAVQKRIVNPHTTLQKEKGGLEDKKKEFIILSRLAGEESNVSFLQRDK
jgi:chromosome segregation ATPase